MRVSVIAASSGIGEVSAISFPPFDATYLVSNFFWFSICFGCLFLFVSKFLAPAVNEIIEDRRSKLDADRTAAEKFRVELGELKDAYQVSISEACRESGALLLEVREKVRERVSSASSLLETQTKAQLAEVSEEVSRIRADVSLNAVAAEVAEAVVFSMMGSKVDASRLESMLSRH